MNNNRGHFSLEALGEKLVACGGEKNVEIYDIADDQWTLIQNEVLEHYFDLATIILNDKVYVIGGSAKDGNGARLLKDCISCVDVNNATISRVSSLPFRAAYHACALLTVPNTATRAVSSQNN